MATKLSLKNKNVLVTCGPTWVAIDQVRVISNISSGEFGHLIAQELEDAGFKVTLLEGPVTHHQSFKSVKVIPFQYYDDLSEQLERQLKNKFSVVIHAAAVSDYRPQNTYATKIRSSFAQIKLNLVPTDKIIDRIKTLNPKVFLVGFKLETTTDLEFLKSQTENLFTKAQCNLVVANVVNGKSYEGMILDPKRSVLASAKNRQDLSRRLVEILKEQA